MTATTHNCRVTLYRGYTIQKSESPHGGFDFFLTRSGIDKDNVIRAESIDEAKEWIDELVMSEYPAFYKVETYALIWNIRLPIITKFTWLSEAVKFASERNGLVIAEFKSI